MLLVSHSKACARSEYSEYPSIMSLLVVLCYTWVVRYCTGASTALSAHSGLHIAGRRKLSISFPLSSLASNFLSTSYSVTVAGHAGLVLLDEGLAIGGRVVGFGEEHALVALGLFFLAHATGLIARIHMLACISRWESRLPYLRLGGLVGLGLGDGRGGGGGGDGFCRFWLVNGWVDG